MSESSYPRSDGDEVDDATAADAADVAGELLDAKGDGSSGGGGGGGGGGLSEADRHALEEFNRDYLLPTISPGTKEPGAVPGALSLHDHPVTSAPDGWQLPPADIVDAFANAPRPETLPVGETVYRFIGQSADPDKLAESATGSWWTRELPKTEAGWHSSYAVKGEWNMDGGYVEVTLEHPVNAWIGETAGQESSMPDYILQGGKEQIWVPRGTIDPVAHGSSLRDSLHPSPWSPK